jgi:hypothetical protein
MCAQVRSYAVTAFPHNFRRQTLLNKKLRKQLISLARPTGIEPVFPP